MTGWAGAINARIYLYRGACDPGAVLTGWR